MVCLGCPDPDLQVMRSDHIVNVTIAKVQVGGWVKARMEWNDDLPYPKEAKEAHAGGFPQHGGIVVLYVLTPHCTEAPQYQWGNREPCPGGARSVGLLHTFDTIFQHWPISQIGLPQPQGDLGVTHCCQIASSRPWCKTSLMKVVDQTPKPYCVHTSNSCHPAWGQSL